MRQVIVVMLLFTLFAGSSCSRRWCIARYGERVDTLRVVTYRDSVVYRDTTVYVYLPGDTVREDVVIPCPPPPPDYVPDTAKAETDYAFARAWWSYPVIALELVQKQSRIALELDSVIKESYHWRTEYERIMAIIPERYVPKIYKQAMSICIVIFIIFAVWFVSKFIKIGNT